MRSRPRRRSPGCVDLPLTADLLFEQLYGCRRLPGHTWAWVGILSVGPSEVAHLLAHPYYSHAPSLLPLSTSKNLFPRVTSCLSPKPCPSPCWEALSEFRKQEGGAVLGQLLLSAQQPNRPPEEGTTKARHFAGKGSGEGTQWGQKMNGCHKEGSCPLLF